jgi:hypothetical protein
MGMTMNNPDINLPAEIDAADSRLAINNTNLEMPLDITIRSIALSVAQRHCGDKTVKEGNLYQQLKMDNKLGNALSTEDVIRAALIFEMYLWGKWSQDIAGKAMETVLGEMERAVGAGEFDRSIEGISDEPPIRPHGD